MATRLLLINPKSPESFWSFKWAIETLPTETKTLNPPLGLATLAALCPDDWQVDIIDENVESIPLAPEADIIGICGMGVQFERQKELLAYYRSHGYYVVAGGSYASLSPESYASLADTVIAGEAEYVWREFCNDFENDNPKRLYHETGVVPLTASPVPRFDLLKTNRYTAMSLQFSRGCPYRCEFCDIIVMFGRRPRHKSLDQVGAELDALRALGVREVFFVDDNLIGNKKAAKHLLRYLRDYQERHDYYFRFGTEASLNLADDHELMTLFRDARVAWVFVGIESPDADSLKETKKTQNTRRDILASVREIYMHGIDVLGGFIIGFDNDTVDVFDKQYDFIMASGIQSAMIGLLMAVPKTPLYERLEREGRIIVGQHGSDNSKLGTNVMPKRMTYDEMVSGYRRLHYRLLEYRGIARRIKNKSRFLKQPMTTVGESLREHPGIAAALPIRTFRRWGLRGMFHVLSSIPFWKPRLIPQVIHDWVVGLSMRDYVERHFNPLFDQDRQRVKRYVAALRVKLQRYRRQGSLRIGLSSLKSARPNVSFCMKGRLNRDFVARSATHLERTLRNTRVSLTLRIEEFHAVDRPLLRGLLKRLSRYRDRIVIAADERSRHIIDVDSSVFNLSVDG